MFIITQFEDFSIELLIIFCFVGSHFMLWTLTLVCDKLLIYPDRSFVILTLVFCSGFLFFYQNFIY